MQDRRRSSAITGADELKSLVGEHLGYSDYMEITQDRANKFADATGDHQWIHVDVERAKAGLFGGPIAHGYLTLSLGPVLYPTIVRIEGFSMGVNYGANKVRFLRRSRWIQPAPRREAARRRGHHRWRADDDGVHLRVRGCRQAVLRRRDHLPQLRLAARSPCVPEPRPGPASSHRLRAGLRYPQPHAQTPQPLDPNNNRLCTRLRYPQPGINAPAPLDPNNDRLRTWLRHAQPNANASMEAGLGSAELGDDVPRDELEGLRVGVVSVPGDEAGAPERHVTADLLGHLVRRADEIAGPPGVERLVAQAAGTGGDDLGLRRERTPRATVLRISS